MIPELAKFKDCLAKHFVINDWQAVDIIVAAAVAHKLKGEMLWLRIIGASGSGKTEILRTLTSQQGYVETLETLTPSAIRRGFKPMRRNKETDQLEAVIKGDTMLQRMDGKLVITKELAPLLTKQHEARLEIFGLLRSLHDGELDADYGSFEGHIKQKCRFDWILGTTGQVESENQLEMQLGSRFTDLRWGTPSAEDATNKAIDNIGDMDAVREELANTMASIIARSEAKAGNEFRAWFKNPQHKEHFLKLCHILAVFRTPVVREKYSKNVCEEPLPEVGTRIGQSFAKISMGLFMLGIEDIIPYMIRMTWDGLPSTRRMVLRAICEIENSDRELMPIPGNELTSATQQSIARWSKTISDDGTGLSQQTVSLVMEDLCVLKARDLPWREFLYEKA
jgi:hypothetical protein